MQRAHLIRLRRFVQNPLTQLCVGLILVGTGTAEVVEDIINTHRTFRIGVHHGVIIFGLMQVLQSIPPLVDGIDRWMSAVETKQAQRDADEKKNS